MTKRYMKKRDCTNSLKMHEALVVKKIKRLILRVTRRDCGTFPWLACKYIIFFFYD